MGIISIPWSFRVFYGFLSDNIYIFSGQEYVTRVIELGADSDTDGVVGGVSTDDRDEVGADVCLGGWIWAC